MKTYTIPLDTANAVLQYLATRPYADVADLITKFNSGKVAEEKAEEVVVPPEGIKKK